MAAIYGIINIACIIVVLDPQKTPVDRCKMMLDDANVNVTIVDNEVQDGFKEITDEAMGRKLCPLSEVVSFVAQNPMAVKVEAFPGDTFGVFYTSGTTGAPKDVVIKHSDVLNLACWWKEFFEVKQNDRILLFHL